MTKTHLKLGNIRQIFPIFKFARVAKNITRITNKIASIRPENMIRYLSLDIICSPKLTVFLVLRSGKTLRFSADKNPFIFPRQMETTVYLTSSFTGHTLRQTYPNVHFWSTIRLSFKEFRRCIRRTATPGL